MRYREIICETAEPTPLDRARQQGFDTEEPVYHGTKAGEFAAFKPHFRPNEQLGFGIHVTPDRSFAERYADNSMTGRKGKQPHVFAGYLRKGKMLDADAFYPEGSPEFELAKKLSGKRFWPSSPNEDGSGPQVCWMQASIDHTSGKRAEALIRAAGYDTIRYTSKIIEPGSNRSYSEVAAAISYVVLNPNALRRMDATFDPDQQDSDDLRA